MIIEKAAGQSLKEFAHKNIFQPLGMRNTLFYDDNTDLIRNRVFSYRKREKEGYDNLIMRFDLVGSGGVYSSIEDLFLWDQNFYDNKLGKGGQDIIEKMHIEGLLNNGESSGYAFALHKDIYKGLKTVSHGGSLAGYRAQLMRFPEEQLSIIILANRGDANPTAKSFQIADILLYDKFIDPSLKENNSETQIATNQEPEFTLNQLVGNYEIQVGAQLEISIKNDSLNVLQSWNKSTYKIVNTTGNTYEITNDPSIQFVFSELKKDETQILTVFQEGNETTCKRKESTDLSKLDTEDYTGQFYSKELDATYLLFKEGETLKIKIANYEAQELVIYGKDIFTTDGDLVRFHRSNGKIEGFELDAGRVTNLKFEKK